MKEKVMKLLSAVAIAALTVPLVMPAMASEGIGAIVVDSTKILVNGEGHKRTFPCNGRNLIVEGRKHTVTTTGLCGSVDVNGEGHVVTAEVMPKGKLTVGGTLHKVRWKSTGEPEQDLSGIDNKVERLK